MRRELFSVLLVCPMVVSAQSVAWNCMQLDPPYYSTSGGYANYQLHLEYSLMDSTGFDPYIIFYVEDAISNISIATCDLEDTASGFVGNWLVANKGDVANEGTTRHKGQYLNHAKIDGETGYTIYNLTGTVPQEYYLIFAVENLFDYNNSLPDPRYAYGWVHLAVNDDMSLSLFDSAMSLDGSLLVVGAIPEPTSGVLAVLGIALLALRRRRIKCRCGFW